MQHKADIIVQATELTSIISLIQQGSKKTDLIEAIHSYNEFLKVGHILSTLLPGLDFQKYTDKSLESSIKQLNKHLFDLGLDNTIEDPGFSGPNKNQELLRWKVGETLPLIDLKKEQAYQEIIKLLAQGKSANNKSANEAEIICLASRSGFEKKGKNFKTIYIRENYPLHCAIDNKVIRLLLEHGANPNLPGYFSTMEERDSMQADDYYGPCAFYDKGKDNLSAFEFSLKRYNIFSDNAISSGWSNKVGNLDILNMLTSAMHELAKQTDVDILLKSFTATLNGLNELDKMKKNLEASLSSSAELKERTIRLHDEVMQRYELTQLKASILKNVLFQKLSLPIWLVLRAGHAQEDNLFLNFPFELFQLIMVALSRTDLCEQAAKKAEFDRDVYGYQCELQIQVFRKILAIMGEDAFAVFELNYLIFINTISPQELISFIENIKVNIGKPDFNGVNINKSGFNEVNINKDDLNKVYINKTDIKIEMLILEAWQLAKTHYKNFTSKNELLLEDLCSFMADKNQTYKLLNNSIYKIKLFDGKNLFESAKEKHLLALRKDIIKQIDAPPVKMRHEKTDERNSQLYSTPRNRGGRGGGGNR
jgi:hypothetical protein